MKIGLIARADNSGLGVQTLDFAKHVNPEKSLIVDLSHLNGLTTHPERFPGAEVLKYVPYPKVNESCPVSKAAIDSFLDGLDLVFTCETPYDSYLFLEARRRGIKTILQYNFEFLDNLENKEAPRPDLFMAPSCWRYEDADFSNKVFIPVPVDTERFKYVHRTSAKTFLHLAGNSTLEDRNGTLLLIASWRDVKFGANLLIKSPRVINFYGSPNVEVDNRKIEDNLELYQTGDVFIMPRKYGGLCLPLNEALALGMPVIMTDVCPQSEFISSSSLVRCSSTKRVNTKASIEVHTVDHNALAAKVDELTNSPDLVSALSKQSGEIAQVISWKKMLPIYNQVFEAVMDGVTPPDLFTWPNPDG